MNFSHLHTHSHYSILDGLNSPAVLAQRAKDLGQTSLAITDHGALYGAVEFTKEATKIGVKPIVGCEVYVTAGSRFDKEGETYHLILLAMNQEGYRNLVRLVTKANLEGFYRKPRVDHALLAEHSEGLICLSACLGGEVAQSILNQPGDPWRIAAQYTEIFGDRYYLEVQDHGQEEDAVVNTIVGEVARDYNIPVVVTQDAHYAAQEDAHLHDIVLCVQTGATLTDEKRFRFSGPDYYLTSAEELAAKFPQEWVTNAGAVADRCSPIDFAPTDNLPRYTPLPEGLTAIDYVRELCYARNPVDPARLEYELSVIEQTGFADYFLVVWDMISGAKSLDVRVGPGRGSAGGSYVADLLGITQTDPLKYGLLSERFLNLERKSMPDIDTDFSDKRRDRVITYLQQRHGEDRVAQVATFGTMGARSAIRNIGRALGAPLERVDALAKSIPFNAAHPLSIEDARSIPEFIELSSAPDMEPIVKYAEQVEGMVRHVSTHAAGVIVGRHSFDGDLPVMRPPGGGLIPVAQYDMSILAEQGYLKLDVLGLSNLSIIDECLEVAAQRGAPVDFDNIPLDDARVYAMIGKGDTHGVFQSETYGAKKILKQLQPKSIEDLGVAVALNRPGPLEGGVVDAYMERRHGRAEPTYLVPELSEVLADTYGIIVYQDQVMQVAVAVAGYTLGEADVLRAAMGKKDPEKMAKQRVKFVDGAVARGVAKATAGELFDTMAYFAGYGFNKAHAIAYGLLTYWTAYLKFHRPLEFTIALLNVREGKDTKTKIDKSAVIINDARRHGISVLPPDINRSGVDFEPVGDDILYGLASVKGVGELQAQTIIEARNKGGKFTSLIDLCLRVNLSRVNSRCLELLIKQGAMRKWGSEQELLGLLDAVIDAARTEKAFQYAESHGDFQKRRRSRGKKLA